MGPGLGSELEQSPLELAGGGVNVLDALPLVLPHLKELAHLVSRILLFNCV